MTDDEKYLAVIDRMIDLEQALRRLLRVHDGACRLDHHGFCQEHAFEQPCGVAVARATLAAAPGASAGLLEASRAAATLLWHLRVGPDNPTLVALEAAITKATGAGS